jgi:hypothetical protein
MKFPLAYTNDLVRLASSAIVAISEDRLALFQGSPNSDNEPFKSSIVQRVFG